MARSSKGTITPIKSFSHKLLTKSGAKIGSLELSWFRLMKKRDVTQPILPRYSIKYFIPLTFVKLHIHTQFMLKSIPQSSTDTVFSLFSVKVV